MRRLQDGGPGDGETCTGGYWKSYPPCHKKTAATTTLSTARGRSSSMTHHTHMQPSGGACFMIAKYP